MNKHISDTDIPDGVELQLLDKATAFIVASEKRREIKGTCFVVQKTDKDMFLVTCRHVVKQACQGQCYAGLKVGVEFYIKNTPLYRQAVVHVLPESEDDDVAILFIGDLEQLEEIQELEFGFAAESVNRRTTHTYLSYGHRAIEGVVGITAEGEIVGRIQATPGTGRTQKLIITSQQIGPGMSGAPVLDRQRNLVVGIVTGQVSGEHNILAIDCAIIPELVPFVQPYPQQAMRLRDSGQRISDVARNLAIKSRKEYKVKFYHETAIDESYFVVRQSLFEGLKQDWNDGLVHITGLVGFAGSGKSSLVRFWLDELLKQPPEDLVSVFWWSFDIDPVVNTFLDEFLIFLLGKDKAQEVNPDISKVDLLGSIIQERSVLLVLDGLHALQSNEIETLSQFAEESPVKQLLEYFALRNHQSYCVAISRQPLVDFFFYITYRQRFVEALTEEESIYLLRRLGVVDSDERLREIAHYWDGHVLSLELLANQIDEKGHLSTIEFMAIADAHRQIDLALHYYDDQLNPAERSLMQIFSMFERLVPTWTIQFLADSQSPLTEAFVKQGEQDEWIIDNVLIDKSIKNLAQRRLLQVDAGFVGVHPVVRNYYRAIFRQQPQSEQQNLHTDIARYWFERSRVEDNSNQAIRDYLFSALRHLFLDINNPEPIRTNYLHNYLQHPVAYRLWDLPQNPYILENRYIIVSKIGEGGQGTVWFGYDLASLQQVAIKILAPTHKLAETMSIRDSSETDAIRREFIVLAQLNAERQLHEHIVQIVHLIPPPPHKRDNFYIVMKRYAGGTLLTFMRERYKAGGVFHLREVALLLNKLANALDFVHERKIIHRDIKPNNILFEDKTLERPRIVDFGLATREDIKLAAQEGVVGTLLYITPEQLQEHDSTGQTDQYSLALVIYEMLARTHPFATKPVGQLAMAHLLETPAPLHEVRPDVPPQVSEVLAKALEKEPGQRYPNMKTFAEAFWAAIGTAAYTDPVLPAMQSTTKIRVIKDETIISSRIHPVITEQISTDELADLGSDRPKKSVQLLSSGGDDVPDKQTPPARTTPQPTAVLPEDVILSNPPQPDLIVARQTVTKSEEVEVHEMPAVPNNDDIKFSAFHPTHVHAGQQCLALVYLHRTSLLHHVQQDAKKQTDEFHYVGIESLQLPLAIDLELNTSVSVELLPNPYLRFDLRNSKLEDEWNGRVNRLEIRFEVLDAVPDDQPIVLELMMRLNGVDITRITMIMSVTADTPEAAVMTAEMPQNHWQANETLSEIQIDLWRKVALVYAPDDYSHIDEIKRTYMGLDVKVIDAQDFWTRQNWKNEFRVELEKTEQFYLYWSNHTHNDYNIEQAIWLALDTCQRCSQFITVHYIDNPVPRPPKKLMRIEPRKSPHNIDIKFVDSPKRIWVRPAPPLRLSSVILLALVVFVVAAMGLNYFLDIQTGIQTPALVTDTVEVTASTLVSSNPTSPVPATTTATPTSITATSDLLSTQNTATAAYVLAQQVQMTANRNNELAQTQAAMNMTATVDAIMIAAQTETQTARNMTATADAIIIAAQTQTQALLLLTVTESAARTATAASTTITLEGVLNDLLVNSDAEEQSQLQYDCVHFNAAYLQFQQLPLEEIEAVSNDLSDYVEAIYDECEGKTGPIHMERGPYLNIRNELRRILLELSN